MTEQATQKHKVIVSRDHPSLPGHFPDQPIVPGVVILDQLMRLWQKENKTLIKKIMNTKFVNPLSADIACSVQFSEKKQHEITFIVSEDDHGTIICKGSFLYHA